MSEPTAEPTAAPQCYRHPGRETWIRCQRCDRPICPDCMRSAAVGFQCPNCVKEGAKTTRSARSAYGGALSQNPSLVSLVLIGLNAAVWLAITAAGGSDSALAYKLGITPSLGARPDTSINQMVPYDGVAHGAWWQLITSAFTHISILHLATNMLALYFVGPALEQVLGRVRFIVLYLVAAITGSAGVMLFSDQNQLTVGASGAIFGLLGALAVVTYKVGGDWRNVLTWIGLNLFITFAIPNISWQGHLGGLLGGTLVALAYVYAPRERRAWYQFAAAGIVLAAAVALIVVRAQTLAA